MSFRGGTRRPCLFQPSPWGEGGQFASSELVGWGVGCTLWFSSATKRLQNTSSVAFGDTCPSRGRLFPRNDNYITSLYLGLPADRILYLYEYQASARCCHSERFPLSFWAARRIFKILRASPQDDKSSQTNKTNSYQNTNYRKIQQFFMLNSIIFDPKKSIDVAERHMFLDFLSCDSLH